MKNRFRRILAKRVLAFSLIEVSIALIIVGLLMVGVMKGKSIIENARMTALVQQLAGYKMAISHFEERYHALPGDYRGALEALGVESGPGNGAWEGEGLDKESSAGRAWAHLVAADLISPCGENEGDTLGPDQGAPTTKVGGVITVAYNPNAWGGKWLVVGAPNQKSGQDPLFTPEQASVILKKFETTSPVQGDVRFSGDKCLHNQKLNLAEKSPACVLFVRV